MAQKEVTPKHATKKPWTFLKDQKQIQVESLPPPTKKKQTGVHPCPHQPLHDKINPQDCQVASPLVI